jgi:FtsP/CotA-like multicopper oxidase with cupredoxin domain
VNLIRGPFPGTLLNGQRTPAPLELQAGVTYRLRLINIRGDLFTELALTDRETPVQWRTVAVDGADLPASARKESPATLLFAPGMIRDVEFTPRAPGRLTLRYENGRMPPPDRKPVTLPVIVK